MNTVYNILNTQNMFSADDSYLLKPKKDRFKEIVSTFHNMNYEQLKYIETYMYQTDKLSYDFNNGDYILFWDIRSCLLHYIDKINSTQSNIHPISERFKIFCEDNTFKHSNN